MIPAAGTRLVGGPGTRYEVVGPAWQGERHLYLRARKLFYNFRYPADSLDEAPGDEALDVLIRLPIGGPGSSHFEREVVLNLPGLSYFLEWLDLIEHPTGDKDSPWLVFADPHAKPLDSGAKPDIEATIGLAFEVLAMLDGLHRAGLGVAANGPGEFLPRGPDHWLFLGTDRIRAVAGGKEHTRTDLAAWARLTESLLGVEPGAAWTPPDSLPHALRERSAWLSRRVRLCLDGEPAKRPTSVAEVVEGTTGPKGPLAALRRFMGQPRDDSRATGST